MGLDTLILSKQQIVNVIMRRLGLSQGAAEAWLASRKDLTPPVKRSALDAAITKTRQQRRGTYHAPVRTSGPGSTPTGADDEPDFEF